MVRSSIAIQIQMVRWLWRAGDWDAWNGGVSSYHRMPVNTIGCHQIRQQLFLLHITCSHQRLIAHPSIPLLSFKVKASACSFHLCSIITPTNTPIYTVSHFPLYSFYSWSVLRSDFRSVHHMRSSCWRLSFIITTSIPYITSTSWILAWVGDLLLSFLICLQGEGMVSSLWEFLCSFFLWQLYVCMECTEGITSLPFFKQRRFLCLFSTHSMNTRKWYTYIFYYAVTVISVYISPCVFRCRYAE